MLLVVALFVFLIGSAFIWQAAAERADARRFLPPGKLIESVHVQVAGSAGVPVVIESGVAASSTGWVLVLPAISSFCRAFAYDRPGYGWSAPSSRPRTPDQYMAELDSIVQFAGTPAVLVGHSFGGLLVQLYAARNPENVRALVLVDPAHTSEWADPQPATLHQLGRGVMLSRRGAWLARTGFVRAALVSLAAGARGVSKLFSRAASTKKGTGYLEKLIGEIRKLPPEVWPVIQSHWCRPASFRAMSDQLESLPVVASAVARELVPFSIPVTVISGGHLTPALLADHAAIAARSEHGQHVIAAGSGHWVHLDRPDLVIEAIRQAIAAAG